MRLRPVVAAVLLVAPLVGAWPSAPAVAAATCQGQEATLVGTPGRSLTGTAGPDVVVTNGAPRVSTLAGDDVVCVTRSTTRVSAGEGDDSVVAQLTGSLDRYVTADLGAGEDRYRGWVGRDTVQGSDATGQDTETDVIATAGGRDVVVVGARNTVLTDEVDLGAGPGNVNVRSSSAAPGVVLRAGGTALLNLGSYGGAWTLDNRAGTATQDGERRFRFTGFASFAPIGDSLRFLGTAKDETVSTVGVPLVASMGGGDDEVSLTEDTYSATDPGFDEGDLSGSRVLGGPGRDEVQLKTHGGFGDANPRDAYLNVDLARELARFDGAHDVGVEGFESTRFYSNRVVRFVGTATGDRVHASGCNVEVDGSGGDDVMSVYEDPYDGDEADCATQQRVLRGGPGADVVAVAADRTRVWGGDGPDVIRVDELLWWDAADLYANGGAGDDLLVGTTGTEGGTATDTFEGGPGNDVLRGHVGDDRLYGGTGRDVADGGPGRDLCRGETRRACER